MKILKISNLKTNLKKIVLAVLSSAFILSSSPPLSDFKTFAASPNPSHINVISDTNKVFIYDGYEINYSFQQYIGWRKVNISLTNTGTETIESWALYFDFLGTVTDTFECRILGDENGFSYLKNAGYNGDIAPGSTVSFQYNLTDVEADFPNTFQFVQTRQLCAESDFVASLSISYLSQWDTSFYGSITLSNLTDRPVEAWEFDFDCNFVITASNSADIKLIKTPTGYRIKGSYNKILSANSTVMLSFTGKNPGGNFTPIIDNFVLSGARVRVEVDEEIKNNTLDDLKVLNEEAYYPLEIDCRADGEICSIDGKYSDILVTDDKSALKSLYSIQNLIGFDNPGDEFIIDRIGSYDTYTSYHFNQIYNNVKVYGSSTTVIVRNNGEILSMGTDYRNISGIETTPVLTEDNIIDIFDIDKAELYIWNFGEYENIPILVYVFNKDSEFLVISAIDGSIIESSSNILGYENYDVQGDGFEGFDLRDKLSKIELDNDIKIENRNDEFWGLSGF